MIKQSQIKRTLEHPNSIDTVRSILMRSELGSRAALADAVCQDFGFLDSCGATQRAGCAKAVVPRRYASWSRPDILSCPLGMLVMRRGPGSAERQGVLGHPRGTPVAPPLDVPEQAGCVRALCSCSRLTLPRACACGMS